jgi:uncharacterized protein (DUF58 family)
VKPEDAPVRRTYRFRLTGLIYLAVTAFLAIAAISSQNNLLFWCLGLSLAGIAISGLASGAGLMGLRVEREPIGDASAGGELVIRYKVRNENRFTPAFALVISECEPARRRRAVAPWRRFSTRPVAFVACVGPGQTVQVEARARAFRRGRPEFTEFNVASTFPFGLANKSLRFVQHRTALVYPGASAVRASVIKALRAGGEQLGPSAARGGESGDLFGIREYLPGDPLKSISWRATARVGTLVVKQHARPSPRRLWVRLELEGEPNEEAVESTISLAAGVLQIAADQGFAIGLLCPGLGLSSLPAPGRVGLRNALSRLAIIGFQGDDGLVPDAEAAPALRDSVITVRSHAAEGPPPDGGLLLAAAAPHTWRAERPAPIASGVGAGSA